MNTSTADADINTLINYASTLTQLKFSQGKHWGCCPLPGHDDKNPSFTIDERTGRWKCWVCNISGSNAIWLYMEINGGDYQDAKKALGLWDDSRRAPKPRPPQPPRTHTSDDRRECYKIARATLVRMRDCKITYKGKEYENHKFVLGCIRTHPERDEYIKRICSDIGGMNWSEQDRQSIEIFTTLFLNEAYQTPDPGLLCK